MSYAIDGAQHRMVEVGDVTLSIYEAGPTDGDRPVVLLAHGFPELAYSWRHQIAPLAAAGFQVVAPDQRGYGETSRPDAITDYDIDHLTGDLVGLLDALDAQQAVFVGHDWGGLVVWQMPLLHRARVAGVVGLNTPFLPRTPIPPIELFRNLGGDSNYIVEFQTPGRADEILARDVAGLFDALMRRPGTPEQMAAASDGMGQATGITWERLIAAPRAGDLFVTPEEMAVYVDTFTETGFTGGINWYRNFDRNWGNHPEQAGARLDDLPCLMITATNDPVLTPALAAGMPDLVSDLEMHELEGCGHWTQAERPDETNALMIDWLTRRF